MNVSLFSETLALVIFGLVIGLTFYLITKIDIKIRLKVLLAVLLFGVILSITLVAIVIWVTQSGNELPPKFWLMILPFTFCLFLLPGVLFSRRYINRQLKPKKRGRKPKLVEVIKVIKIRYLIIYSLVDIILSLIFVLLVTNSYYHYYPTLSTVFNIGQPRSLVLSQENKIVVQYSDNAPSVNNNTIESSVYNTNPETDKGEAYNLIIPGSVSKFKARGGWIYIPSIALSPNPLIKLPVLVMVPGSPGVVGNIYQGAGLESALTQLAITHHGITPLVYVADDNGTTFNDTECVNSPKGNVQTYLTVDVPNYIKSHFNVSDNPDNWAIGGISMGGTCSIMLALTNPNVYHYFVDIGGEVGPTFNSGSPQTTTNVLFYGSTKAYDLHQPTYLLAHNKYKGIGGFFGSGISDDPDVIAGTTLLYNTTKKDGFDVVYETVSGGHTFNVFTQLVKEATPWISNRIGATKCIEQPLCQ